MPRSPPARWAARPDRAPHAEQIDLDDLLKDRFVDERDGGRRLGGDAGIGPDHIEAARPCQHLLHDLIESRPIGHAADECARMLSAELVDHGGEPGLIEVDERHAGATGHENTSAGGTNAAGAAGEENGSSVEIKAWGHHEPSVVGGSRKNGTRLGGAPEGRR